ncbi:MAG TPA: hypothetical protein VKE98_17645 [Gemmataceae bacterium]|nr:hypothetical protein [Gemmataceae bacterium]
MSRHFSFTLCSTAPSSYQLLALQLNTEQFKFYIRSILATTVRVKHSALRVVLVPKIVPGLDALGCWYPNSQDIFARLVATRTNKRWDGGLTVLLAASDAIPQSVDRAILDSATDIPAEVQETMFLGNI